MIDGFTGKSRGCGKALTAGRVLSVAAGRGSDVEWWIMFNYLFRGCLASRVFSVFGFHGNKKSRNWN